MAGENQIVLQSILDIPSVASLHAELTTRLKAGADVKLHAGQVERVDTAALQLILSFIQAADTAGQACAWEQVSDPFYTAAELCGLRQALKLEGP